MISDTASPKIERHKAAIVRHNLSRPLRLAIQTGILDSSTTFFDYGCGHGDDVKRLVAQGIKSSGWDPYYVPDATKTSAEVVNLGYVVNVIENEQERHETLLNAWALTQKVLVVSAQVLI